MSCCGSRSSSCPRRNDSVDPLINSIMRGMEFKLGGTLKKKQKTSSDRREDEARPATSSEAVNDSASDWRDKYKHVRDMHIHALEKQHLADVVFIVGEEKASFSAHRMILALGSPVFEAMFYGGLAEKGESVSIPDVDPKGFENLLRFLYCGEIEFDNDVIAFKTFFAADKYCVISLKDRCENYLNRCKLKASNVWIFLESSLFLNSLNIKDRCLAYLKVSTKAALEDNSFLDVTTKTVETFLSLDTLSVTEMGLLLHLIRWAEHKSKSEPDPVDSYRKYLFSLLKLVRFYNLSHQDFVLFHEMPKLKDVLSDSDALAILKYIVKPAVCSLPEWCCKKVRHVVSTMSEHSYSSELNRSAATSSAKNDKKNDSSSCQNRNKRKREKPRKLEICDLTSSSSDSSDSSDNGTETIYSSVSISTVSSPSLSDWSSERLED